ncbi:MAG: hypothetical protein Q8P72_02350 [Candidatus Roizmanbacteria bacterium]|nr:hypothetical protein [Candidatus Roizmanbacteria bacterium]
MVRPLPDNFLYNNFGIDVVNEVPTATLERAMADLLYFNPDYYLDNIKGIDMQKMKLTKKEVGYI